MKRGFIWQKVNKQCAFYCVTSDDSGDVTQCFDVPGDATVETHDKEKDAVVFSQGQDKKLINFWWTSFLKNMHAHERITTFKEKSWEFLELGTIKSSFSHPGCPKRKTTFGKKEKYALVVH